MFFEVANYITCSTVSIPLAILSDAAGNVVSSIGVSVPGYALAGLEQSKIFPYTPIEDMVKAFLAYEKGAITNKWMDAQGPFAHLMPEGIFKGWHRLHGHHVITDGFRALTNPNLSIVDFYKHIATDVVTKNGIPLFPEAITRGIAATLGVKLHTLMPWVCMNILDIGSSIFAVFHAGSNVMQVVSGTAEWGLGYGMNTLGVGALEISSGFATTNPILIGSGAVDVACGIYTAAEYYNQPFFCGVPVEDILHAGSVGVGVSSILALVEVLVKRNSTTRAEKVKILGERIATGGILSALSAIAVPMSVTAGIGLSGVKLAKAAADDTNRYIELLPVTGEFSHQMDQRIVDRFGDGSTMANMKKYLEE